MDVWYALIAISQDNWLGTATGVLTPTVTHKLKWCLTLNHLCHYYSKEQSPMTLAMSKPYLKLENNLLMQQVRRTPTNCWTHKASNTTRYIATDAWLRCNAFDVGSYQAQLQATMAELQDFVGAHVTQSAEHQKGIVWQTFQNKIISWRWSCLAVCSYSWEARS